MRAPILLPVEDRNAGPIRIWKLPDPGGKYVLGVDVAEGVEGGDYTVGFMLEGRTKEHVATYISQIDPTFAAPELAAFGWYYNCAIMAIERVNHGDSLIRHFAHYDPYPNLYKPVRKPLKQGKTSGRSIVQDFGVDPRSSKSIMIDDLRDAVRRLAPIHDYLFYHEGITWTLDKDGTPQPAEGAHDDCLTAAAVAFHVAKEIFGGFAPVQAPANPGSAGWKAMMKRAWWNRVFERHNEVCKPPAPDVEGANEIN